MSKRKATDQAEAEPEFFADRFKGQVAIVTGGADGLGKGITQRLVKEGAKVVIFDFNDALATEVAGALTAEGFQVEAIKVNVADEDQVEAAINKVAEDNGRLDVLVNCAGIVGPNKIKLADVSGADFDKVQAVNVKGSFNVTKHALRHMSTRDYGRILLIASIAGKDGNAGMACYSTSKAAVIGLTKAVGKEYAETGITVNALAPAVIRTAMVDALEPETVKYMTDKIPMKRCGTIEEVAAIASWIVSKESSFNTGFCFDLTGGRTTY
eukprot:m.10264 g.10264  ORF g.10264 m.10264 type:complete len:268 (+) comp3737_c0_seq1:100-903(+)